MPEKSTEIAHKCPKIIGTSLTNDQNVFENSTKWPKNTLKRKNNAIKRHKWQKMSKNAMKMDQKCQNGIGNHQIMAKTNIETCNNDQNSS